MYNRNEGDILFIGNGLNRVSNNGTAWNTLLDQLAGKPKTQHEENVRREKPFTLWFEELCNRFGKKNLKQLFSDEIHRNLTHHHLHEQVMSLDMQHILTTNYDYNLELSSQEKWSSGIPPRPRKMKGVTYDRLVQEYETARKSQIRMDASPSQTWA